MDPHEIKQARENLRAIFVSLFRTTHANKTRGTAADVWWRVPSITINNHRSYLIIITRAAVCPHSPRFLGALSSDRVNWVMMTGCFVLDWPWQILAWTTQWPQLKSLILAPLSESKINHFNIKCHRMIRSMPILDTPACLHNLTVIRIYRLRMTRKCRPRRKTVIITKYGFERLW